MKFILSFTGLKIAKVLTAFSFFVSFSLTGFSQDTLPSVQFYAKKGRGLGLVTSDSSFSLNFQFRMQNRAGYTSSSHEDLSPSSWEFRVRRMRLKFDGFILNPKLTYYFQLSVSRGDMDWRGPDNSSVNHSPNIVRDAVIYYQAAKKLRLGFGQTKLPGNRQRVVSSGDLQFADRSIVNSTFTFDRDFGFFGHYTTEFFNLRAAVTSGEGRNSVSSNTGLSYTGRIEVLPFGKFTGNNDYIEGDHEREIIPKVSLASSFNFNDLAVREGGQLGADLYSPRTLKGLEFDALVKYRGWSWYNEYMTRNTNNPITTNGNNTRYVYVGEGFLTQLSYLFRNNFEVAGRYSVIKPFSSLYQNVAYPNVSVRRHDQIELGVTKYLRGHRLKVQGNLIYANFTNLNSRVKSGTWSAIFQIELGI